MKSPSSSSVVVCLSMVAYLVAGCQPLGPSRDGPTKGGNPIVQSGTPQVPSDDDSDDRPLGGTPGHKPEGGTDLNLGLPTEGLPELGSWQHLKWLEKVIQKTGNQSLLGDAQEMERLKKLSYQEVLGELLGTHGFEDTLVDFGLFYMGRKLTSVRNGSGNYSTEIFETPNAVTAARVFRQNGDFLGALLGERQPIYLLPLARLSGVFDSKTGESIGRDLSEPEQRQLLYKMSLDRVADALKISESNLSREEIDQQICDDPSASTDILGQLGSGGTLFLVTSNWFMDAFIYCSAPDGKSINWNSFYRDIGGKLQTLFSALENYTPDKYAVASILDIKPLAISPGKAEEQSSITSSVWQTLVNSSTNENRKRASYVLKRFFCDDLTPIAIEAPTDEHAKGRHASDPACQSCHYKLDPMAGFFRYHGIVGIDFSQSDTIIFDDLSRKNLNEYLSAWNKPDGSLDVGFIRSVNDPAQNVMGSTLSDLFQIIKTAPEARQCLVKRTFEYYLGSDQMMDRGYLAFLADAFDIESKQNSSLAYGNLVKRILLSQTAVASNPNSSQCYDHDPRSREVSNLPCEVAYVVKKNCENCHNSQNPSGGLALDRWVALGGGGTGFVHAKGGQQIAPTQTLNSILDRISTQDKDLRMPLSQEMTNKDREVLFLWLNDKIAKGGNP